jgi:hypothetical protein
MPTMDAVKQELLKALQGNNTSRGNQNVQVNLHFYESDMPEAQQHLRDYLTGKGMTEVTQRQLMSRVVQPGQPALSETEYFLSDVQMGLMLAVPLQEQLGLHEKTAARLAAELQQELGVSSPNAAVTPAVAPVTKGQGTDTSPPPPPAS